MLTAALLLPLTVDLLLPLTVTLPLIVFLSCEEDAEWLPEEAALLRAAATLALCLCQFGQSGDDVNRGWRTCQAWRREGHRHDACRSGCRRPCCCCWRRKSSCVLTGDLCSCGANCDERLQTLFSASKVSGATAQKLADEASLQCACIRL